MTYNANEIRAKVLRRKILQLIAENYVLSASLISHTLLLSYATVLRHLRILSQEGYIELYKQGRTLYAKIKDNSREIQILNSELGGFKKLNEKTSMTGHEGGSSFSGTKEVKKSGRY
jgi:DNA-binding transcriptional ArsR family regulator